MFPRQDRFALVPPFRGNVGRRASETSPCRRAGNAKRRVRPPQGDGERPDRRRGNRDPRALLGWPGWLPRRLQLVFTRSSGRNSLSVVAPSMWKQSRTDSFGFDREFFGHRPGGQSSQSGVRHGPQRDGEVKPQKTVSKVAVVVSAPVRSVAPQAGPKVRHGLSGFTSAGTS